ncbi:hypothetical protein LTR50_006779 [Elasticomyces elasticus]|nr:hypothetical protein LTR50_006779 [Elasticomyces elasticus]
MSHSAERGTEASNYDFGPYNDLDEDERDAFRERYALEDFEDWLPGPFDEDNDYPTLEPDYNSRPVGPSRPLLSSPFRFDDFLNPAHVGGDPEDPQEGHEAAQGDLPRPLLPLSPAEHAPPTTRMGNIPSSVSSVFDCLPPGPTAVQPNLPRVNSFGYILSSTPDPPSPLHPLLPPIRSTTYRSSLPRRGSPPTPSHRSITTNSIVDLTTSPTDNTMPHQVQPRKRPHASATQQSRAEQPMTKRRRTSQSSTPAFNAETKSRIEEIDLVSDGSTEALLQKQREAAIKAQHEESKKPLRLNDLTCIICMETYTNLTATHCGHIFCHECLTQAILAGEKSSDKASGSCPVCRKPISRKGKNHMIPLALMKGTRAAS